MAPLYSLFLGFLLHCCLTVDCRGINFFLWRSQVHFVSFGIFNLELWDDAMAKFLPLTKKDVLYVGKSGLCVTIGSFCIRGNTTIYNSLSSV